MTLAQPPPRAPRPAARAPPRRPRPRRVAPPSRPRPPRRCQPPSAVCAAAAAPPVATATRVAAAVDGAAAAGVPAALAPLPLPLVSRAPLPVLVAVPWRERGAPPPTAALLASTPSTGRHWRRTLSPRVLPVQETHRRVRHGTRADDTVDAAAVSPKHARRARVPIAQLLDKCDHWRPRNPSQHPVLQTAAPSP